MDLPDQAVSPADDTQPEALTRASLMAASRFFFACTFFSRKNSSRSSSSSSPCERHSLLQGSCHAHDELPEIPQHRMVHPQTQ